MSTISIQTPKIDRILTYINEHLHEDLTLAELSAEFCLSYYHLCQLFDRSIGITPHKYLLKQRVERAKELLVRSNYTMLDISIECGFANPGHLAKCFRQQVGVSPRQYRLML
jgi:AraC family transcriptional regulator